MNSLFSRNLKIALGRGAAGLLIAILVLAAFPVTPAYAAGAITITVSAQSGTLTYGTTGTATFTVTVVQAGGTSASILLSATNLPSGCTVDWVGNPVAGAHAPGSTATLTIHTTGPHPATPAGNLAFTVANNVDTHVGTGTLVVAKRALSVTATGINKTYDGTSSASATLQDDRLQNDALTTAYTSATFADKNVGNSKTVSVSGISLSGADSGNYTYNTSASTTANISQAALHVTATGTNRVYDGTTTASVTLGDDRAAGDVLTLGYGGASFTSKAAGPARTVNVTGITVSGTDTANYTYNTSTTATADIAQRLLTITATGVDKTYDGTTSATVTLADDRIGGDVFTTDYTGAAFTSKNAELDVTINVSGITATGTDAGNYTHNTSATAAANISQRALTVTATGVNKTYDGTDVATVNLSDNRVSGDVLTTGYTSAVFADKKAANGVAISVSGISVTGTDAANYTYNTSATAAADISQRLLTVTATGVNKPYDATTDAAVTLSSDKLPGDDVTPHHTSATFAAKDVGSGVLISVTGITLSGTDSGNYTHNAAASASADISQRALTVTATGVNKVYDGTTDASVTLDDNALPGDDVEESYASAVFADKKVDTGVAISVSGITLGGTDAGNYLPNTTATASANITPRSLTVSATGIDKVYDGTTDAAVTLSDDRVPGDTLTTSYGLATFADKKAGTGVAISVTGIGVTGTDADNYTHNLTASASADITPRGLSVSATGVDKTYDGTTTASVTLADDALSGDDVTPSYAAAEFASKNAGPAVSISVSGITIGGADAGSYTPNTTASASADIATRSLLLTAHGVGKPYDGTATAAVTFTDDRVPGDDLTPDYASATFADINAGSDIAISVTGITLGGADANNYSFNTTASTSATIAKTNASIDVTAYHVTYDGSSHTASGAALGVEPVPADLSSLLDLSGTAHTNAGTYHGDAWSFAGNNNYYSTSGTVDDVIDKAAAFIQVHPYDVTYDGGGHTATGSAAGVESVPVDLTSLLDLSSTSHTGAGSYAADGWTFAGNDNYNSASGTVSDNIAKANADIHVSGYSFVYDGAQHVATGTASGVEAVPTDLSSLLDLTGTAHTDVGTYSADQWSFAGNENYNSASGTVNDEIIAATPVFQASPASWNFPILKVNLTSLPQTFTITNNGNASLVISAVSLTGPDAAHFLITTPTPCASALAVGETCTVTVVFKPTTASPGTKTASLSFTDNAGNHDVALTGKSASQAVQNGSFETYLNATARIPRYWTAAGFSAADGKTTLIKRVGKASIKISNTAAVAKALSQTRLLSGSAGDTFLLSAWARGYKIPSTPGLVRVEVLLYSGTHVVQRATIAFPNGNYSFRQRTKLVTATSAYTKVVIKVIYSKSAGTIWFDGVSLLRSH